MQNTRQQIKNVYEAAVLKRSRKPSFSKLQLPRQRLSKFQYYGHNSSKFVFSAYRYAAAALLSASTALVFSDNSNCQENLYDCYERGEHLGEGAFGSVFIVTEKATNTKYALKQIDKHRTHTAAFRKEVHILQHIHKLGGHPNVAGLKEAFEDDDHYYLVLELVSGGELFQHLIENGAYSEKTASHLLNGVVDALVFLHKNSLVHLDLKPENLMLSDYSDNPVVKLVDFGSASRRGTYSDSDIGTRVYWPPETQTKDRVLLDPSVDLWALGVIMYIMLVGVHPFDINGKLDDEEVSVNIMCGRAALGKEFVGHLSQSAQDLLRRLLSTNPKKRPTIRELKNHPWIKGETASDEEMVGVDTRLKSFQALQRKLEAGIFTTLINAAPDFEINSTAQRSSRSSKNSGGYVQQSSVGDAVNLVENVLNMFDPSNKGYISADDFSNVLLDMMAPELESSEKANLSRTLKSQTGNRNPDVPLGVLDIVQLAKNYSLQQYPAGTILFSEDDDGDYMYFLNRGHVDICVTDAQGQRIPLASFKNGQFFGESALISSRKRSATAVCQTDVEVLRISKESFARMTVDAPSAMISVRSVNEKRLLQRLKRMMQVLAQVKNVRLAQDEYLVRQGSPAESIFTVLEGNFRIQREGKGGKLKSLVALRGPGAILGEMGFLFDHPHEHSIVCGSTSGCLVSEISTHELGELFQESPHLQSVLKNLSRKRKFRAKIAHFLPNDQKNWTKEELRKAFDMISTDDGNGKKSISLTELEAVMKGLEGFDVNDEEILLLMNLIDVSGSGQILFEDFLRVMSENN